MSAVEERFDVCAALGEKQRMFDPNVGEWFEFLVTDPLIICAPAQFWYVQRVFPHWLADLEVAGLRVLGWEIPEPGAYLTESRQFKPRGLYGARTEVNFSVKLATQGAIRDMGVEDDNVVTGVVSLVRKKFALFVLEKYPLPFDPLNPLYEAESRVSLFGGLPRASVEELELCRFKEFLDEEGAALLSFETRKYNYSSSVMLFEGAFTWHHPFSELAIMGVRRRAGEWLGRKSRLKHPIREFHLDFESPR